jgi:cytochrome c-type biogenesis protein CcmH/NrfF
MRRLTGILFAIILMVASGPGIQAQTGAAQTEAISPHPVGNDAISQLKSPYCPGMMLEVCPSPQAAELRDSLHLLAAEGWTADSLISWMLTNHGEEWRAVPEVRGKGLLAWAIPPAALLMGLLLTMAVLHRFRAGRLAQEETPVQLSPEDESRLAQAMEDLKASEDTPF